MRRRFHRLRRAVHCPGLLEELGERLQGARLHGGGRGHPHRRAGRVVEHPGGQEPCVPLAPGEITAQDARVAFTDSNLDRSTVPRMPAVVNDANLGFVCSVSGSCCRTGESICQARVAWIGAWFEGWQSPIQRLAGSPPVVPPRTWLAAVGWRRLGLIHPDEEPVRGGLRLRLKTPPLTPVRR